MTCCCTPIGSCACSRLLQTRYYGLQLASIEEKVRKEAEKRGPSSPEEQDYHIKPQDFKLMHKTIQSMRRCEAAAAGQQTHMPFVTILFDWQVHVSMLQSKHQNINALQPEHLLYPDGFKFLWTGRAMLSSQAAHYTESLNLRIPSPVFWNFHASISCRMPRKFAGGRVNCQDTYR